MSPNDPEDRPDDATEEIPPEPADSQRDLDRERERERAIREAEARAAAADEEDRSGRFKRLTRILMDRGEDAKYLLGTVVDTSDRAKTEAVKLIAREVRHYLEALRLTDDLREFATSHSLEVKASFHLKPLAKDGDEEEVEDEPSAEEPAPKRKKPKAD